MLVCMTTGGKHIGELVIAHAENIGYGCDRVTAWCSECGMIKYYDRVDGREMNVIIHYPNITKRNHDELQHHPRQ